MTIPIQVLSLRVGNINTATFTGEKHIWYYTIQKNKVPLLPSSSV